MAAIRTERPSSKLEAHKSNPNRREKIGGGLLSNIAKFAIDSTINYSFKAFPGRKQAHQIVREGLKDHPPLSASLDDKKKPEDLKLVMEEMHAKMEQMQEDTNIVKQQHKTSAEHVEGSRHPKKMPDEGVQGSDLLQNKKKKIFIRSRL
ncbi:hypothetical protein ACFX13_031452 [Malus domestica]